MDNFNIKQNVLKIKKARAEREHRVICDVVINSISGRFIYEFSTLSGITIDFSITPLKGDTTTFYSFNINRLANVEA